MFFHSGKHTSFINTYWQGAISKKLKKRSSKWPLTDFNNHPSESPISKPWRLKIEILEDWIVKREFKSEKHLEPDE